MSLRSPLVLEPLDVLLCQRFVPEKGGAVRWMHEVYGGWPGSVEVVTHAYSAEQLARAGTSQLEPASAEDGALQSLRIERLDIQMPDWGLDQVSNWRRYFRMRTSITARLAAPENAGRVIRVHCCNAVPDAVSLLGLRSRYPDRLRILSYAHGEETLACLSSKQLTWLMQRAHKSLDLMIANSTYTESIVRDHISADRLVVVNPGVNFAEFSDAKDTGARWRAQEGLQDRLVILTMGRLDYRKNQSAVIDAVHSLVDRHPNLLYIIAGNGERRQELEEQTSRLGLEDHVRFLGAVDDAARVALFGACDIFAMPAIRHGNDVEGFGMVFLEANACGKPVVAGCTGGQVDAVVDGETGLLVDGTDAAQVGAAIEKLVVNPDLRQEMGRAALEFARKRDWQGVISRTVELANEHLGA
jgi:phosphatidyl-myo-inositol dimannoside synthase